MQNEEVLKFTDILIDATFEIDFNGAGYKDVWRLKGISSNTGKCIMPSAPVQVYVVDHDVIMTTKSGSVYCLLNQSFNTQLIENISDAIENEGYEWI